MKCSRCSKLFLPAMGRHKPRLHRQLQWSHNIKIPVTQTHRRIARTHTNVRTKIFQVNLGYPVAPVIFSLKLFLLSQDMPNPFIPFLLQYARGVAHRYFRQYLHKPPLQGHSAVKRLMFLVELMHAINYYFNCVLTCQLTHQFSRSIYAVGCHQ